MNVAGFFYDFREIQVEKVVGFLTQVVNAATARTRGAELEMTALLLRDLSVDGGLSWLDAHYTKFRDDDPFTLTEGEVDLSGNQLNKSPEWSANLGIQGTQAFGSFAEASARYEWSYKGTMYYDHFNHFDWRGRPYQLSNVYLDVSRPGGRLGVRGFVKNLTDKAYFAGQFTASQLIVGPITYYGMPRTWGVELYYRF